MTTSTTESPETQAKIVIPRPGAQTRPLEPVPGVVYPDAQIRTFRWSFDDDLAAELEAGLVLRLEVIARIDELRENSSGPRWNVQVLEVGRISE